MEKEQRLPDGELQIMQIVWRQQPPVPRSAIERGLDRALAPSTVITVLSRLCDKGFLKVAHRGRTNYYTPLIAERDYLARQSRSLLDQLFGGSVAAFATSLCDGGISREEIEQLRRLLEEGAL